MVFFKILILFVLAISPLEAMGLDDQIETLMTGEYDPDEVMNSIALSTKPPGFEFLPETEDAIVISADVTFWCSNQQRQVPIKTLVDDSDLEVKVDLGKPFTFIIHGWTDDGQRPWIINATSNYWEFVDTNVCVVDWNRLAAYRYTITANKHTRIVGTYVADFIKSLLKRNVHLDNVSVVGHSLGGQIAGFVGSALDGKLGQIFALDPAGPFFTHPILHKPSDRLDATDAKYVQVIFTTKGILGASVACGHQNFFPNAGKYLQPGCETPEEFFGLNIRVRLSCSHQHAPALFRYSLNPSQVYTGTLCTSYDKYTNLGCISEPTDRMGIYSSRTSGDFYLTTSPDKPFLQTSNSL